MDIASYFTASVALASALLCTGMAYAGTSWSCYENQLQWCSDCVPSCPDLIQPFNRKDNVGPYGEKEATPPHQDNT